VEVEVITMSYNSGGGHHHDVEVEVITMSY
jgi:hypothetical protein